MQATARSPLIGVDELAALLEADGCVVLDVRYRMGGPPGAGEYARGHIPGAVNVPTGANLAADGRFRSPDELRSTYAVTAGHEVVAYCGSGVTAAHDILAMAVAGIDATLYPGSWSEWVTDPARPVATGE